MYFMTNFCSKKEEKQTVSDAKNERMTIRSTIAFGALKDRRTHNYQLQSFFYFVSFILLIPFETGKIMTGVV